MFNSISLHSPSQAGQWPAPSLAGAIFFQFRQIPLNGANHTDKTDIPAFGMDITFFF